MCDNWYNCYCGQKICTHTPGHGNCYDKWKAEQEAKKDKK